MRRTLQDFANSRAPQVLGECNTDFPRLAAYVNEAIERLISVFGEDGFWGGWAKIVFNVPRSDPFITLPLQFARIIATDVCKMPIRIQNEWYEFLEAGIGLRTPCDGRNHCGAIEMFERGVWSTAYDLSATNQKLRVYITDVRDIGKRILFQDAKDQNGNGIYSTDVTYTVIGFYMTFNQPFVDSSMIVTSFGGIQKDQTYGDVILKQVDATTGVESLLARYGPDEMAPQYRRYYLNRLPNGCCFQGEPVQPARITCLAKYEFKPVSRPTDNLLTGNVPALIKACNAIRHEQMDDPNARQLGKQEWADAVQMLNEELDKYLGKTNPAVNLAPWGTAKLNRQMIGQLM